jgi:hypothetical protein
LDHCTLSQTAQGYQFNGTVVQSMDGQPARIEYQIVLDQHWQTRRVTVNATIGGQQRQLALTVDDQQRWWQDGIELAQCAGLLDVDLGVTPATNTLPMRRLAMAVGERRAVTAAWMSFPEMVMEPLPQHYTRLAEQRYLYESPDFRAELAVDDLSLIVQYGDWFERITTQS